MVTAGAAELRDAFIGWQLRRHDRQLILLNLDRVRAEEVYVYNNTLEVALRLVPLPRRRAELQLNMKAEDESGRRLVILPSEEIDILYAEMFPDVIRQLRRDTTIPARLKTPIIDPQWRATFFAPEWSRDWDDRSKMEVVEYFTHLLGAQADPPNATETATQVFADYVLGRLFGQYRPWVLLPNPIAAIEGNEIEPHILIKYTAELGTPFSSWDHFRAAIGRPIALAAIFPLLAGSSSHGRLKLPDGLAFCAGMSRPPNATRGSLGRDQVQVYAGTGDVAAVYERREAPAMVVQGRVSQSPSAKFLAGAFIGLIAVLPLLWAMYRVVTDGNGKVLPRAWIVSNLRLANVFPMISRVQPPDALAASAVALPIAIGLLSAAWTTPNLRPFATSQVVIAAILLVAWLFAAILPGVGLAALLCGVGLAGWHVIRGLRGAPQPSVAWREP